MNIKDIVENAELPWGLHDACLERIEIDWLTERVVFEARVKMDERQTTERRVRITVTGLVYCAIEAPMIDAKNHYDPVPPGGPWIDSGMYAADKVPSDLPRTPDGAFLNYFFVNDWNRTIHICGREASMEWLDDGPAPVRQSTGFGLPGDEI